MTPSPSAPQFNSAAVLGVGLIGASCALALRKRGLIKKITGFARNEERLQLAKERGIIDAAAADPAAACRDADLIIFASPVGSFLDLVRLAAPGMKEHAVVTDVGSVKGSLVTSMEEALPRAVRYVGAHPIAGSDRSGMEFASADLFVQAKCIITPTACTDPQALGSVTALWKALGADVVIMDPDEHDRVYAAVSHLPHLVAYALMNAVDDMNRSYLDYAGTGFRDMTRIASSSEILWADICAMNRKNLLELLGHFERQMAMMSRHLADGDEAALKKAFENARKLRETLG